MKRKKLLIIGTGLAACQLARYLFMDYQITMITKGKLTHGNSVKAQGGVACVVETNDHLDSHIHDTLIAGGFHNDVDQVQKLIAGAQSAINDLIDSGFSFDRSGRRYHLGKEGAHQYRRILHAGGDQTGRRLIKHYHHLLKGHVTIIENQTVIDLMTVAGRCVGVRTVNQKLKRQEYIADVVVLATGGYAGIFENHSNHPLLMGDGIALGYRAGANVKDLEFIQFHPTLASIKGRPFLISEAVRGEGAVLVNGQGERLLDNYPLKDLSSRDVVSQALYQVQLNGEEIYLDITPVKQFDQRFPQITGLLKRHALDLSQGLIPVQPGAHFTMGGLQVDANHETAVNGLFAVGEVAATGVHGANRLASNSLLEALVFGKDLAEVLKGRKPIEKPQKIICEPVNPLTQTRSLSIAALKRYNERYLGVIRYEKELLHYQKILNQYPMTKQASIYHPEKSLDDYQSEQLLLVSRLVLSAALSRRNSLGAHQIRRQEAEQAVKG